MAFTVAIAGRPNVGKSTLFNRLVGKRLALVDDTPGVTRDVREGSGALGPLRFRLLDTAGLEEAPEGALQRRMSEGSDAALKAADAILFVIDARAGVTPADREVARRIRRHGRKVVLVANKCEGRAGEDALAEAHALGLGEPVAVSAEHGEGMGELYEALAPLLQDTAGEEEGAQGDALREALHLAIIGRPNAGKSTLINRILGAERVLASPEAGTTRDAIAVDHLWQGRKLRLIDTAGMRKKANVRGKIEKLAVADALRALQFCEVAILVLDAQHPLEQQDNALAALVEQEGRALVIAVNKWDLVPDSQAWLKSLREVLGNVLSQLEDVPVVPVSAKTGEGVDRLLQAAFDIRDIWEKRFSTPELNRWLEEAQQRHSPPLVKGRRIKLRYMTQQKGRPPSFLLFSNLSDIPDHYLRYLKSGLRERFGLKGVPIRFKIRKQKNPYSGKGE